METRPLLDRDNQLYFAGVAAVFAGVAVAFLADFLLCFTCFLVVVVVLGAVLVDGVAAGACAASVKPAVARVNVKPRTAEVIFLIVVVFLFFEARFPIGLCNDGRGNC